MPRIALTDDQKANIRRLHQREFLSNVQLATRFRCSVDTIRAVLNGPRKRTKSGERTPYEREPD